MTSNENKIDRIIESFPTLGLFLRQIGDEFVMTGPTGEHKLAVSVTNNERLQAHWEGFVEGGLAVLADDLDDWALLVWTLSPTMARVNLAGLFDKEARARCDGFGRMSIQELEDLGALFDWSHVRDSSEDAIESAASFIREHALRSASPRVES